MAETVSLIISLGFLIFLIGFLVYTLSLMYSAFRGSPYVPTRKRFLHQILDAAKAKKGMKMLELGCGDGRMLVAAVADYGLTGYGVDINPLMIKRAKWNARKLPDSKIKFETKNLKDISVGNFDIVYLFLLPQLLAKFAPVWEKQADKKTLFISHAFVIKRWEKYLEKTIPGKPYDTHFYRMK